MHGRNVVLINRHPGLKHLLSVGNILVCHLVLNIKPKCVLISLLMRII